MDHCKVGRWMGISWKFMPSFIDVFEFHHAPERAQHDPCLVGIIAAADQFLIAQQASQLQSAPLLSTPVQTATPQNITPQSNDAPVPESPASPETTDSPRPLEETVLPVLRKCLPDLGDSELLSVMELLRTEYLHLLPLVQLGMMFTAGDAA